MKVTTEHGHPRELTLLEENARYMPHEEFAQLVANIRRDGALSSAPFVWYDEATDRKVVLSGNHRVKASLEADLDDIPWLQCDEPLTRDQQLAIQLSHNAINGRDDPAILAKLYSDIESLDWREYAGLDDRDLELLEQVDVGNLSEANLDFQTLALVFLPDDAEKAKAAFGDAKKLAGGDVTWLARFEDHLRILEAIAAASSSHDVLNMGGAVSYVLDVFERHIGDLSAGWFDEDTGEAKHSRWVPIATALGNDVIPAASAAVVKKAFGKMRDRGEVTDREGWRALELWARAYLAS